MIIKNPENSLAQRMLGAVDLAIDLATLGEYGLEPVAAVGPRRERPGQATGWEAFATARRGDCPGDAVAANRRRLRTPA